MSGTALCWWASLKRPLERAIKLARLLECPYKITPNGTSMYENGDTTEKLVNCLIEKGIQHLYFKTGAYILDYIYCKLIWPKLVR